jgi:hypothetical protein
VLIGSVVQAEKSGVPELSLAKSVFELMLVVCMLHRTTEADQVRLRPVSQLCDHRMTIYNQTSTVKPSSMTCLQSLFSHGWRLQDLEITWTIETQLDCLSSHRREHLWSLL